VTVDPAQIIKISRAANLRSQQWGNCQLALSALVDWVSKLHVGEKSDGAVWAPATFGGKRRLANMVEGVELAVFDSDAGHTLAQLKVRFQLLGWYACIIPSSSWGKDITECSADHYDDWVKEHADVAAASLPERYLVEALHKTPGVASGAKVISRPYLPVTRKDGSKYLKSLIRFRHGPCEKYRVICVLSQRFDLSTPVQRRLWKKHYDAMIDQIGLPFDRSTGSPERLFYLSYLSPDRIAQARLHHAEIQGTHIDIAQLPEPKARERARKGGFRTFAEDHIEGRGADDEHLDYTWRDTDTDTELDLRALAAKGVFQHLELADVLQENGWPQDDRGEVDGKHHIECPFAHEHTDQNDGGTFVWNASDYHRTGMTDLQPGAGINCRHNSCDGRDRLEFILGFLDKGGLKPENLRGALSAAKDKSLADDFEPIDPDRVVLRALVKPDMTWTRDKVCASASSLRRLKRETPARFDACAAGWDALDIITLDELELLVDLADDETDDDPGPKGGSAAKSDQRWRDKLRYSKDGTPLASATNITLCLEHGLGLGGGVVAYNMLKDRLDIRDPSRLPWARPNEEARAWTDNDDTEAAMALDQLLSGLVIRPHTVTPIIESLGRRHAYHPVRDYLHSLVWDKIPRLDRLLIDYGGADDNPFVRAATARTLIAAVARAMKPGVKVDTALILESTQGFRKSTLFSALAVDTAWFSDSTGHIGEKTSAEMACSHWVVEMAELAGLTKGDLNQVKAFLSRQYDKFRPAYGRRVVDYPRQCIMVGTVNPETTGYLKDLTGNRRFWIVKVGKISWDYIHEERDQLWAEAKARYAAGEKWWFDDNSEAHLIEAQQEIAKGRTAEPELCETLRKFIGHKPGVSGHDRDFVDGWGPRMVPLTVIPSATHYWNAVGTPTRDISFSNKLAFNQACQSLGWEVYQETRPTNAIGLEKGSRFYISPAGVEALKEGRLHEWLAIQARLGAVAGLPNPLEGMADIIVLEDRKKPKPKKDDGLDPAKPL
jgi:predicted P-loop ATPase